MFLKLFLVMVIALATMPIFIPILMLRLKGILERKDIAYFSLEAGALPKDDRRKRKYPRGVKKNELKSVKTLFLYADATLLALPFWVITGFRVAVHNGSKIVFLFSLAAAVMICLVYYSYRRCMTVKDWYFFIGRINFYPRNFERYEPILFNITRVVWFFSIAMFAASLVIGA